MCPFLLLLVENIDVSTIRMIVDNDNVPAGPRPTEIGDHDNDGVSDLIVKLLHEPQSYGPLIAGYPSKCWNTISLHVDPGAGVVGGTAEL